MAIAGFWPVPRRIGGPSGRRPAGGWSGRMVRWRRCFRHMTPIPCGGRSLTRLGWMNWRNGRRGKRPGTSCSSVCGWGLAARSVLKKAWMWSRFTSWGLCVVVRCGAFDHVGLRARARARAACTACSLSASSALVASSSSSRGASLSMARAMAMRWRWPPDRRTPRSPRKVP